MNIPLVYHNVTIDTGTLLYVDLDYFSAKTQTESIFIKYEAALELFYVGLITLTSKAAN